MSEHLREDDLVGNVWQWCDTEKYMIFDQHTGLQRIAGRGFLVSKEQALSHIHQMGWESRRHIVKVDCISACKVSDSGQLKDSE